MYEESFNKVVVEGAEYLVGTCKRVSLVTSVFEYELIQICSEFLCEGDQDQVKFQSRLSALKERFEEAVIAEMENREYFYCDTCGWWLWGDQLSSSSSEKVCESCHVETMQVEEEAE